MGLTFPTGDMTHGEVARLGEPGIAKACAGHRILLCDETCFWCGRYPDITIKRTWAERAARVFDNEPVVGLTPRAREAVLV